MTNIDLEGPLKTAKDVSFVLLSNILFALVILLILIAVIYYVTVSKTKDAEYDFLSYLKEQLPFDNKSKGSVDVDNKQKPSEEPNPKLSLANKLSFLNIHFQNVKADFFKYPILLFILSIIFVVLFNLPKRHSFHKTANYSIPLLFTIYLLILYKSYKSNYIDINNYNLNRLKSVFIFFSVLLTLITFYVKDPGNVIKNNFGESLLFIIIIAIFIFAQLLVTLGLNRANPIKSYAQKRQFDESQGNSKVLKMISYSLYFIFLFAMTVSMASLGSSHKNWTTLLITTIVVGLLWGGTNVALFYKNRIRGDDLATGESFSKYFGIFIGIGILIASVILAIKFTNDFTGKMTTFGKICTALICFTLLSLLYKFIKSKYRIDNTKFDHLFNLIFEGFFYIPCLLDNVFGFIYRFCKFLFTNEGSFSFYNENDKISMLIIICILVFILIYILFTKINHKLVTQNGNVLINQPIYFNKEYHLGNKETLDQVSDYKYNFAISFWMLLHSNPSNNADQYFSLLNYANKPNFLYNPSKHDFKVICDISGSDNQEIIHTSNQLKFQKWTNVVLNCDGNHMDLFIDNNLVKSVSGIVPFINIDSLTVGENNGANGGICNIIYFDKPLSVGNMFILYHSVKYKSPPISDVITQ